MGRLKAPEEPGKPQRTMAPRLDVPISSVRKQRKEVRTLVPTVRFEGEVQPYPYQQECLDCIQEARGRDGRALIVMASGLGKTVTAALDVKRWLAEHQGERVLVLCHQNEILRQLRETLEAVLGEDHSFGYFHGQDRSGVDAQLVFASFQTLRNEIGIFRTQEFGYIVVDETHHSQAGTYRTTIERFNPQFLLGMTATVERADEKDIREIYGKEVFSLPLEKALARGLLTPVDYRVITGDDREVSDEDLRKMTIVELNALLAFSGSYADIVQVIRKQIEERGRLRAMVFCRSISECDRIAEYLPGAVSVHSALSLAEQAKRLGQFRAGAMSILVTVDKFNEGVDIPEADLIVFLRPSGTSKTVFFQQLGRGLRRAAGKKQVTVLDFVADSKRLKLVHELWKRVQEEQEKLEEEGSARFDVAIGALEFSSVAERVLYALQMRKKGGASLRRREDKRALSHRFRQFQVEIGKPIEARHIQELIATGQVKEDVVRRVFGGAGSAARAIRRQEELLAIWRDCARELGRNPTRFDFMAFVQGSETRESWFSFQEAFGSEYDREVEEDLELYLATLVQGEPRRRTEKFVGQDAPTKAVVRSGEVPNLTRVERGKDAPQEDVAVQLVSVAQGTHEVREIPISRIRRYENQPREYFSQADLEGLAASIRTVGQLQPVLLRSIEGDSEHDFELIDGERRFRAAKMAGSAVLRAIVMETRSAEEQFLVSAIANFGRAEHTPMETARALQFLMERFGWSVKRAAESFGKTASWAYQYLSLLKLDPEVQTMLSPGRERSKQLPLTVGYLLSNFSGEQQVALAKEVIEKGMRVREAQALIRQAAAAAGVSAAKSTRGRKPSDYFRSLRTAVRGMSERAEQLIELSAGDVEEMMSRRSLSEQREVVAQVEKLSRTTVVLHEMLRAVVLDAGLEEGTAPEE